MPKNKKTTILSIETSCDETAIAILECSGSFKTWPKFKIIANKVSSQIKIHRPFGGVVPNLAKREHIKNLPKIFKSLKLMPQKIKQIDCIAVTTGPGLEPALWAGITFAQDLAKKIKKPIIGANHMEGHLYGFLLKHKTINPKHKMPNSKNDFGFGISNLKFPAIALVVSGGHTVLLKMKSLTKWEKIGETVDDAVGEAFDKVARILDLPYPGGPEIEKISKKGNSKAVNFPRPMLNQKNYDFSFSGLKTSVLYYLRDNPDTNKADIAASFQRAAIDVLTKKTIKAADEFFAKSIILCGGVACNKTLRETIKLEAEKQGLTFITPEIQFNTDNAAMIAVSSYIHLLAKKKNIKLEANSNLNL